MTVIWYIAKGILFERGGFDLYIVQGNSVQGHKLHVQQSGDGGRENSKIIKILVMF